MVDDHHIVFCCDRRAIPGLHVAAYSCLRSARSSGRGLLFHVFSTDIRADEYAALERTLRRAETPFELRAHTMTLPDLSRFPSMRGSWGPYLRIFVPQTLEVERFVYLDVDIVCLADVIELLSTDLGGAPAAFMAETTMGATPDLSVLRFLPGNESSPYLNSGVMLVNPATWRRERVTERCLEVLGSGPVDRWDQTALNVVLHDNWATLPERYNFHTNRRSNWRDLGSAAGRRGKILHFLDYPKPWDIGAEFIHPHYSIWREVLECTDLAEFRSWQRWAGRRWPGTRRALSGYKQAVKDRLLFRALQKGWLSEVKGMQSRPPG